MGSYWCIMAPHGCPSDACPGELLVRDVRTALQVCAWREGPLRAVPMLIGAHRDSCSRSIAASACTSSFMPASSASTAWIAAPSSSILQSAN